uniref:DUF4794 domain-containing protein n=1 Tax=Anopheles epiroticus TaxID=199890 RepID=A0A182P4J0_9DIPT
MRFLIVLAALAAVAVANPLISIRVNVESPDGPVLPPGPPGPPPPPGPGPDPEQPPPQPYSPNQLKRDVLPAAESDVVFPVNEPNPAGTLVNIEVFVDNQRQGSVPINPDYPPPTPY